MGTTNLISFRQKLVLGANQLYKLYSNSFLLHTKFYIQLKSIYKMQTMLKD